MFLKSKISYLEYRSEIQNGPLFINKIEPIKIVATVFCLRSYKVTAKYFTKVNGWTKLRILFLCVITSITIARFFQEYIETLSIDLLFLATFSTTLAEMVNILAFWISNSNSTCVIKIFKNFDYVEMLIPGTNGYLHNGNHLTIIIHFLNFLIVTIDSINEFNIYLPRRQCFLELGDLLAVGEFIYSLALGCTFIQVCSFFNIISSYVNILNFLICRAYGRLDYYYENNDAFMFLLKNKIFRYGEINTSRIPKQLQIENVIQMYDKLLKNIEITNHKFHIVVSNMHR